MRGCCGLFGLIPFTKGRWRMGINGPGRSPADGRGAARRTGGPMPGGRDARDYGQTGAGLYCFAGRRRRSRAAGCMCRAVAGEGAVSAVIWQHQRPRENDGDWRIVSAGQGLRWRGGWAEEGRSMSCRPDTARRHEEDKRRPVAGSPQYRRHGIKAKSLVCDIL